MARRCSCRPRQQRDDLLARAQLPERYRRCRLSNFHTTGNDELFAAKRACQHYVDHFLSPDGHFCETGLLFSGPPGTGKTHLAVSVMVELIETYSLRGRFIDFTTLIHDIQSTFEPSTPGSKSAILDPIKSSEILVLDELGAQKTTPWVRDILYLIMNTRYFAAAADSVHDQLPSRRQARRSRSRPWRRSSLWRAPRAAHSLDAVQSPARNGPAHRSR